MRPSPLLSVIDDVVWRQLEALGRRPTIHEIADALDLSAAQLRRRVKSMGGITLRSVLTRACLSYAENLICDGTKIEAAMRLAGFRNKTNFNAQFSRRFGALPNQWRDSGKMHQSTAPLCRLSVPEKASAASTCTLDLQASRPLIGRNMIPSEPDSRRTEMLLGNNRSDAILRVLALAGFLGTITGAAFAPEPVNAACVEDECEGGNTCKTNIGHQTQCNVLSGGTCATDACGVE